MRNTCGVAYNHRDPGTYTACERESRTPPAVLSLSRLCSPTFDPSDPSRLDFQPQATSVSRTPCAHQSPRNFFSGATTLRAFVVCQTKLFFNVSCQRKRCVKQESSYLSTRTARGYVLESLGPWVNVVRTRRIEVNSCTSRWTVIEGETEQSSTTWTLTQILQNLRVWVSAVHTNIGTQ